MTDLIPISQEEQALGRSVLILQETEERIQETEALYRKAREEALAAVDLEFDRLLRSLEIYKTRKTEFQAEVEQELERVVRTTNRRKFLGGYLACSVRRRPNPNYDRETLLDWGAHHAPQALVFPKDKSRKADALAYLIEHAPELLDPDEKSIVKLASSVFDDRKTDASYDEQVTLIFPDSPVEVQTYISLHSLDKLTGEALDRLRQSIEIEE